MKKKLLIILIIIFSLTGCIKNNFDMKLETDNSLSISIINAFQTTDKSIGYTEEDKQKYIDNGYKVEDYNENSYEGIKISLDIDNINNVSNSDVDVVELTTIINQKTSDIKLFKSEKIEGGTLYTANFTYNLTMDELEQYSSVNVGDFSSYQSIMDLKYSITLPVKVEDSNASTIEGSTYSWTLEFGKINEIKYSFIIKDSDITKEKTKYEKKTKKKKNTTTNVETKKMTVQEGISSIIGIVILVAVIVLYYTIKKKISKKLTKKKNKTGYHYKAPESIKEKK